MARFASSEWFRAESSARSVIRPHGEEARALRDAPGMLLILGARAVSNHEGGPSFETRPRPEERASSATRVLGALWRASRRAAAPQDVPTSSFETHRTVGKRRLCDAPQDEVGQAVVAARPSAAIRFTLAEAAD